MTDLVFVNRKPGDILNKSGNRLNIKLKSGGVTPEQTVEIIYINTFKGIFKFETHPEDIKGVEFTISIPPDASKIQRRKYVRVDTNIRCETPCYTTQNRIYNIKTPIEFFIFNMSESGMKIATDYNFPEGAKILFDLTLNSIPIKFSAEVIRVDKSNDKRLPYNFGCKFVSISSPNVLKSYIFDLMREDLKRDRGF